MKKLTSIYSLLSFTAFILLATIPENVNAQDVRVTNPSFEDTPRQGTFDLRGRRSQPIKGWYDCGAILFPEATLPDIHDGTSKY